MLREGPALVLPAPHEEQIGRHGLAVAAPHNPALQQPPQSIKTLFIPHLKVRCGDTKD